MGLDLRTPALCPDKPEPLFCQEVVGLIVNTRLKFAVGWPFQMTLAGQRVLEKFWRNFRASSAPISA
jgi:hypothetical protein